MLKKNRNYASVEIPIKVKATLSEVILEEFMSEDDGKVSGIYP